MQAAATREFHELRELRHISPGFIVVVIAMLGVAGYGAFVWADQQLRTGLGITSACLNFTAPSSIREYVDRRRWRIVGRSGVPADVPGGLAGAVVQVRRGVLTHEAPEGGFAAPQDHEFLGRQQVFSDLSLERFLKPRASDL